MHPFMIHLSIILFFLIPILAQLLDAKHPITGSTPATASKLEVNVHVTAATPSIGHPPSEEHSTQLRPSNTQLAPSQGELHIVAIGITTILLLSVVWFLWKHLGSNAENGTGDLSAHQAGRSEAVSRGEVLTDSPEGGPSQPEGSPLKPQLRHGQSAPVVSADVTPYSPPPRRATDPLLSEESEGLNNCPATNLQRTATQHGDAFHKLVIAGHHRLQSWIWPSINQPEQAVVCLSIHPRDPSSLRRSLHKGSRDLDQSFLELGRCIFLVVGVDTFGHKDAENDTKYLRQMFESPPHGSSAHRYECLYGPDATYPEIRKTVLALLDEAQADLQPSQIFMLFTGTGDDNNAMCLPNGDVFSESDLSMWLPASSTDQTNEFSVGVLFDICRSAVSRLATAFQPAELAWSCSVGEFAYAIRISEDKLIPRSIFLLAIFLTAHDMKVHNLDNCCFEAAFALHIKHLSELIQFMYHRDHQGQCSRCPAGKQCDAPVAQNPDLEQAGRVVSSLGTLIATHFPERASEVFVAVDQKMLQEGFPGRLCPLSVSRAKQANKPTVKDES
ncbi:hypothetical protein FRC11_009102 [Ceratobasidium sp. 423]|nr:hypothetical protein FRC11_009102 [Ceratobasidium sp. 423]